METGLMVKRFKTDSGITYFLIFEKGNIKKPLVVLDEYEMAEFKYFVNEQAKDVPQYPTI